MIVALDIDTSFEVGNLRKRCDINIFERVKNDLVGYKGTDIRDNYPLRWVNESADFD